MQVDFEQLRQLLAMMREYDLSELELTSENGDKVSLKKRDKNPVQTIVAAAAPQVSPQPLTIGSTTASLFEKPKDDPNENIVVIKSPMVGTFYRSPNPESPAFVSEGDNVTPDSTVCILEAMKVFNEIKADCEGIVKEILVDNEEPVEYGQPLMRIKVVTIGD
ncbi:MAG: acetyl-CoA carboxylase biotin carboxyl carrier protein [Planctomycetes bacterium]|nr:acetyl-CoA carboxylase biotin carboxyl carrier protein [Planctomycetota bacterium]